MISSEQVQAIRGGTAVDRNGDKVGSVGEVYLDDQTGQPAWVTVNTGLFGTSETFVPLQDATVEGDTVRLPYTKDVIKDAPRVNADQHLDVEQEQELYRHYGLTQAGGTTETTTTTTTDRTTGLGTAGTAAAGTAAAGLGNRTDSSFTARDRSTDEDATQVGAPLGGRTDGTGYTERTTQTSTTGYAGTDRSTETRAVDADENKAGSVGLGDRTTGTTTTTTTTTGTTGTAGFAGTTERATTPAADTTGTARGLSAEALKNGLVRHEERLNVGTERREVGKVRVRKYVTTEEQTVQVPVRREEIRLNRETMPERELGVADLESANAFADLDHEFTLHEEVPVVTKQVFAVERIVLGTEMVEEQRDVTESVRKEHFEVEGADGQGFLGTETDRDKGFLGTDKRDDKS